MTIRNITALEVKTLFIALLVGIAHFVSGVMVYFYPNAAFAAPLSMLARLAEYFQVFGTGIIGVTLMIAGAMAIAGSLFSFGQHVHVTLFIPQQALLLMQIWSITASLIYGVYPDGYVPVGGSWFILSDQIWAFILAVSHSLWLIAFIFGGARRGTIPN